MASYSVQKAVDDSTHVIVNSNPTLSHLRSNSPIPIRIKQSKSFLKFCHLVITQVTHFIVSGLVEAEDENGILTS